MAQVLRTNRNPLIGQQALYPGNRLVLKVSGLGPGKRHVVFKSSSTKVKVGPVGTPNDRDLEQTLVIEVDKDITCCFEVTLTPYAGGDNGAVDVTTPRILLSIDARLELPRVETDEGIFVRMLLIESITPGTRTYVNADESLAVMKWMHRVLVNRLAFGPQHFEATKDVTTLTEIIKAPNQVAGFSDYPTLPAGKSQLLNSIMDIANDGANLQAQAYRQYINNAFTVAALPQPDVDPCPTGLYAWRKANAMGPGSNFVLFKTRGGQDFYTLTEEFRKDPLLREQGKKK